MAKRFSDNEKIRRHPYRAMQAWQILVGAAMNRQTLTYVGLSRLMYGKPASGVLDEILGHIAFYCNDHNLPPLTALVVNSSSGVPGDGIPIENVPSVREDVYKFDWFDVLPPRAKALGSAFKSTRT